jgi:hypothetical protein
LRELARFRFPETRTISLGFASGNSSGLGFASNARPQQDIFSFYANAFE